jgi:hypothetical protein
VEPLAPHLVALAPKAVREASEKHREALEKLTRLRSEARAAEAACEQARAADERAAREAVEHGRAIPTAKATKTLAAADSARRAVEAAEQIARGTQHGFITALNGCRDSFTASVASKIADLDAERGRLIDALERAISEERDVRVLAHELDGLAPPGSRLQLFAVRPSRRPVSRERQAMLDRLRAGGD